MKSKHINCISKTGTQQTIDIRKIHNRGLSNQEADFQLIIHMALA